MDNYEKMELLYERLQVIKKDERNEEIVKLAEEMYGIYEDETQELMIRSEDCQCQ